MDTPRLDDLTTTPDEAIVRALTSAWRWRLGDDWSPLLISVWGDVFLQIERSAVWWLNTGTGELTEVAPDPDTFRRLLGGAAAEAWLLPELAAKLYAQGRRPGAGECFTYAIFPIFAEGKYEAWNFAPVPAQEHLALSGELHQQIANLPDGATVSVRVVD